MIAKYIGVVYDQFPVRDRKKVFEFERKSIKIYVKKVIYFLYFSFYLGGVVPISFV